MKKTEDLLKRCISILNGEDSDDTKKSKIKKEVNLHNKEMMTYYDKLSFPERSIAMEGFIGKPKLYRDMGFPENNLGIRLFINPYSGRVVVRDGFMDNFKEKIKDIEECLEKFKHLSEK